MIKTIRTSIAVFLAAGVIIAALAFSFGFFHAPSPASAHSTVALSSVEHISWDPSSIDSGGGTLISFTAELKGTHFPIADVETIDVQLDATFGGAEAACSSVSFPDPSTDPDGNWLITVHFFDCHTHNHVLASAVDDGHLNHATLTVG